ncbi:hypothetical protein BDN72DRAFT_901271 [Pluteus cervinus]|uniref:Uncharacterized protein n=1 Tax=Pluteus cervinus TaxID=181527 RepID=A0ACD3AH78_9AGAR|nr:hypothetical protein BDN72DRAFT_901271 [Pluteus cervinus]
MDNSIQENWATIDTVDILFSDNEVITLPRVVLKVTTGLFEKGMLDYENPQDIELPEPGKILKILFGFICPKDAANLTTATPEVGIQDADFDTLLQVARAAQKYRVEHVIQICQLEMRRRASHLDNCERRQVLAYAAKYRHYDLVDKVAPLLLGTSLPDMFDALDGEVDSQSAWVHYINALEPQRVKWLDDILLAIQRNRDAEYSLHVDSQVLQDLYSTFALSMIPLNELLKKIIGLREIWNTDRHHVHAGFQWYHLISTYKRFPRFSTFFPEERNKRHVGLTDKKADNQASEVEQVQGERSDEPSYEWDSNKMVEVKRSEPKEGEWDGLDDSE